MVCDEGQAWKRHLSLYVPPVASGGTSAGIFSIRLDLPSICLYNAHMKSTSLKAFAKLSKALHEERATLQTRIQEINEVLGNGGRGESSAPLVEKTGGMTAAGRARIAAAQKRRWAKYHASKGSKAGPKKAKRKISAEGKARIAAAQKARWAKIHAEKGK